MKPGTEGLTSPNSDMVAPQEKDRENDRIQVQSKKNHRLAQKKSNSQVTKFKPSCKHHASPDSLINLDTSSDNDSASFADVLLGKKKPTKPFHKRTLNLNPKKGKKDTAVPKKRMKTTPVYPPLILLTLKKNTLASMKARTKIISMKPNWKPPWLPETKKPRTTRYLITNSQQNIPPSMHQPIYKIMINRSYNWFTKK